MRQRTASEIRRLFLDYFASRDHKEMPSHSLIPPDDPTLLFVNAGMVQFKDVFAGKKSVGASRATTSQKVLRVSGKHNDLENVGRTARHHTFFEMLGNFSFGDYFKREAIHFAWQFLTSDEFIGLPTDNLWVTVHPDDSEARKIWVEEVGMPADRVLDDPENFWSAGDTGPCGPCSEIHIDQGPALSGGIEVPFGEGGDRYLELWNLVFMAFDRAPDGTRSDLPSPSIDTGMGLERIAAVVQGKTANYDADLFTTLFRKIEELSGHRYEGRFAPENERPPEIESDVAFRVIADHARATTFLIADGIYPENEGRGYVLRRIMRRAIRFGRKLGLEDTFLVDVCGEVVRSMGDAYPELTAAADTIDKIVRLEEERFGRTLVEGLRLLESAVEARRSAGESELPGDVVFTLYDTHGFPVDLTRLIAEETGFAIDEAGFESAMAAQRERGRASWKGVDHAAAAIYHAVEADTGASQFSGYGSTEGRSAVRAILIDGQRVDLAGPGSEVELTVDETPFYAESGGQVGDRGTMRAGDAGDAIVVDITDVQKRADGLIVHLGRVQSGTLRVGQAVELLVDADHRDPTRRNHSATHLLHWALRQHLGDHVKQRGSLVTPDRLRFDFSHFGPLTDDDMEIVERMVNDRILRNEAVGTAEMTMPEAVEQGAIAFFGEKYGEQVRVVSMAESVELCGGTHVSRTGDIGLFKFVSETGISAGVRRVEAITGAEAVRWVQSQQKRFRILGESLRCGPSEVEKKAEKVLRDLSSAEAEIKRLNQKLANAMSGDQLGQARDIAGVKALALPMDGVSGKELRGLADKLIEKMADGALLLGSRDGEKVTLLVAVSESLTDRLDAGALIRELAPIVGGRGGGKKRLAQAGGKNPENLDEALERFYALVESGVTS